MALPRSDSTFCAQGLCRYLQADHTWTILVSDPADFSSIVFTIIFGKIANIPTDGLPPMLFYMAGIVSWNYFASCLNTTSNTFITNAGLFGKVYFPRLTVPVSVVIINLLTFAIQFTLFLCFLFFFYMRGAAVHPSHMDTPDAITPSADGNSRARNRDHDVLAHHQIS